MKRYAIYIIALFTALMVTNGVWGQTPLNGTYNGKSLNGEYILTGDVILTSQLTVEVGNTATIDLNGKTITRSGTGFVFTCYGTLIIKGNGTITGGTGDRGGCGMVSGTLILEGGTIRDCTSTDSDYGSDAGIHELTQGCGGAIYIQQGGIFQMKGGTIINCKTQKRDKKEFGRGGAVFVDAEGATPGVFEMSGGTISECSANYGGAVYVHKGLEGDKANGSFIMRGNAKIDDCTAYVHGSGVYVAGEFEMTGGSIQKCKDVTTVYGGGVYVDSEATCTIKGGMISENKGGYGGGVYVDGEFNMTGGEISENKGGYGGGVYVTANGNFTLSSTGVISKNEADGDGCGVFVAGTFDMTGGKIKENKSSGWSLTLHSVDGVDHPQTLARPSGEQNRGYGGGVFTIGGTAQFTMSGGTISGNIAPSGGGVMVWDSSTFKMTGGTITENYAIGQGGLGNGGAVYVQNATFNFNGGTLSKNTAVRYGGAVNINASATLSLGGACQIINNQAQHGGGLSQEQGRCIMTLDNAGILISGNMAHGYNSQSAEGNGGGLFIEKGTLTINAGTIENNVATGRGGGASLFVSRIFGDIAANVSGGTISGNTAGVSGGGIDLYVSPQKGGGKDEIDKEHPEKNSVNVNFTNGTLKENRAQDGAGIYVYINPKGTTTGGEQPINTTNEAFMTIGSASTTPLIQENIASGNGGGLGMNNGTFTIVNGSFQSNEALGNGGAVYLGAGQFTVSGEANVMENSAKNGGGFYVENGVVTISQGTIQENTATILGGGLYVYNTGNEKNVSFNGGTFRSNQAAYGGGACVNGKIKLDISSSFEENRAKNGGAIYMMNGVKMNFGAGIIRNNKALQNLTNEEFTQLVSAEGATYNPSTGKVEKSSSEIYGFGGGVFMDQYTTLTFSETAQFGMYNNTALCGGDDILTNGTSTTITLPVTKEMNLTGYNVSNQLYWVEDYPEEDENLTTPANKQAIRYEKALKAAVELGKLENLDSDGTPLPYTLEDTYLCLTLGYDLVFITLKKQNLQQGDDVTFTLSFKSNSGKYVDYNKVILTGNATNEVTKVIAIPSGEWIFKESGWGWKYDTPEYYGANNVELNFNQAPVTITRTQNTVITVKNKLKPIADPSHKDYKKIQEFEHRVVNTLKPRQQSL